MDEDLSPEQMLRRYNMRQGGKFRAYPKCERKGCENTSSGLPTGIGVGLEYHPEHPTPVFEGSVCKKCRRAAERLPIDLVIRYFNGEDVKIPRPKKEV